MRKMNAEYFTIIERCVDSYREANDRSPSVYDIADLTGIPKSTINDIMNGKSPRLDTLEQLATGLKVRITDLFDSPYK